MPRSRIGIFATNASDPPHWTLNLCFGAIPIVWVHFGPFHNENRCKMGLTSAKVCAMKSRQYFPQRTHPIHPIGPKSDFLVRFVPFGCIRGRLVVLRNSVQNRLNKCKSSCHEVASEFFATNAPDPPHWTLNLCFGVIHIIWVHLGPFGCLMKIDAKRAEQVQKFVLRSRVGIFRNERIRSTPLDPNLMFWCVSYFLGAFGTVWLPYETRCKTGRTSAKVRE